MSRASDINWHRGLLRIWLVLSIIWFAAIIFLSQPFDAYQDYRKRVEMREAAQNVLGRLEAGLAAGSIETNDGRVVKGQELLEHKAKAEGLVAEVNQRFEISRDALVRILRASILPPAILLVLGLSIAWAMRGFKEKQT